MLGFLEEKTLGASHQLCNVLADKQTKKAIYSLHFGFLIFIFFFFKEGTRISVDKKQQQKAVGFPFPVVFKFCLVVVVSFFLYSNRLASIKEIEKHLKKKRN